MHCVCVFCVYVIPSQFPPGASITNRLVTGSRRIKLRMADSILPPICSLLLLLCCCCPITISIVFCAPDYFLLRFYIFPSFSRGPAKVGALCEYQ